MHLREPSPMFVLPFASALGPWATTQKRSTRLGIRPCWYVDKNTSLTKEAYQTGKHFWAEKHRNQIATIATALNRANGSSGVREQWKANSFYSTEILAPTIHSQPPVQQRVIDKGFQHSHHTVLVVTQDAHDTVTGNAVVTFDASYLWDIQAPKKKRLRVNTELESCTTKDGPKKNASQIRHRKHK